ncbi:putative hydrolase of HD superfamily [Alkalibacillus filiformis]|uniref:Hydrolase of HD superfamily n=1 Tax=Alkalibacillus filiformis TaxID=200990 RepID=A0ABU0DVB9_9BACI|nr:HD domain-containing protein [Alkalibacillus filiformis]MDQ0352284.1 putative hydrolase of HD superfamily [Alkalibacillus filiformis]
MRQEMKNVLEVIHLAEKLKGEMRHSWLSNGRRESVAEHTWRLSLMAILIEPFLERKVNMLKLLKMITIHDLVEIEAGDIPAFDTLTNEEVKAAKAHQEQKAIESFRTKLNHKLGEEVEQLWYEFEEKETYEAKVANALDKLEAQIQHNEASINTWLEIEYEMSYLLDRHVGFDEAITTLKDLIEEEAEQKMKEAHVDVSEIKAKL